MRALATLRRRIGDWPPLTRDAGAAALVLAGLGCAQAMILLHVPVEALLAGPAVFAAWRLFGGRSALFGALVTAAAVAVALDPAARVAVWRLPVITTVALALGFLAVAFAVAALAAGAAARARAALRERRAKALVDACAQEAVSRIEAAHQRLARAEAEIAEARQQLALAGPGAAPPRDPFGDALRTEGGV